jgi:protein-L-isoaspartate(D-aspartate) O-methyltransferase
MSYIDFMSPLHKSTHRDYLARVNDLKFPKAKAAELAKKWGFDYWDGDRRVNYGGYNYIEGRWEKVGKLFVEHYGLKAGDKILDIGCGKGFLLFDIAKIIPGIDVYGLDISEYAINDSLKDIKKDLDIGCCSQLPYNDKSFDLVISINTIHNLELEQCKIAVKEIVRVSRKNAFIIVDAYNNDQQKKNLFDWNLTAKTILHQNEWIRLFKENNYKGDYFWFCP